MLELFLGLSLTAAQASSQDTCQSMMPATLRSALDTRFPAFALPVMTDNLPEDIDYNRKEGGNGCLGVAEADYNGDGQNDRALLLTSREELRNGRGRRILVVVAFAEVSGWTLSPLRDIDYANRDHLYLETAPPGTYVRTESLPDPPSEPGEVDELTTGNAGVIFGVTESSAVVYVWARGCWEHVWISD